MNSTIRFGFLLTCMVLTGLAAADSTPDRQVRFSVLHEKTYVLSTPLGRIEIFFDEQ